MSIAHNKDYYTINTANIVANPAGIPVYQNNNQGIFNNNPNSNTTDNSQEVYKLQGNASAPATGLDITLKVMSGDKIDILGKSYWKDKNTTQGNSNLVLQNVVQGLLATPGGLAASKGATAAGLTTGANPLSLPAPFLTRNPAAGDEKPMAYINYILLDEQFGYVNSGFVRVGPQNQVTDHFIQGIAVTKNGYLYVYCSNQSPVDVFFDNLQLVQTRSPLVEETHYYPFGLSMSGISSKALNFGDPGNKYKYNGIENNTDFDLNIYDAFYRNLDPQIGRFLQIDPVTTHSESPYVSMGNNPILNKDWLGDFFSWGTPSVQDAYLKLRKDNNKRIGNYLNELSNVLGSDDENSKAQVSQLVKLINSHAELNSQWDEMEASSVEFNVTDEMPITNAAGDTRYNMTQKRIDIRLGKSVNDKTVMAHELRHGYGFLAGELIGGGELSDITDELAGFNAGFLFSDRQAANNVVNGFFDTKWFEENNIKKYPDLYGGLSGKNVSLTLNTPAAVYMKYYNNRISLFMQTNNANKNVKDAIDEANALKFKQIGQPEFRYGSLLNH